MRNLSPLALLLSTALFPACNGCEPPGADAVQFGETFGLAACDDETVAAHPDSRCFTWRAVAGVSMGGGTAARFGFAHPELFDVVADMGGPVSDIEFFFGMLETNHLAGFCSTERLQQLAAEGHDLNDPTDPELWCGTHDVWPLGPTGTQVSPGYLVNVEDSQCAMFRSDYNHWYRGPDAGRGGTFGRNTLLESIMDLSNIYGNPLYYNPDNKYLPPGVPESFLVPPQDESVTADRCANPAVVQNVFNKEYNPDGSLPAITYCDGEPDGTVPREQRGDFVPGNPGASSRVVDFALAVDINGNGKRDFAEPVLANGHERYRDVGADGLADADEPGFDAATNPDPAHDNFDTVNNPDGEEGNFKRDDDEPFEDNGLDGVVGTSDFGEGNGDYDVTPNLKAAYARSPLETFRNMSEEQLKRLDIWMDAGIRDFLNTAQNENALFNVIKKRIPDAHTYNDFPNLPGIEGGQYIYFDADYSRKAMGQVAYLRYGDPAVCPGSDDILGDGNHVGPDVVSRMFTLFMFMSARMPAQGRDEAIGGDISGLGSPNGELTDFAFLDSYESEVLGKTYEYGVMLPPDYFYNTKERYPVLYFFHGQGQDAAGMMAAGLALFGPMKESADAQRLADNKTDLQRAIIIWVDGECPEDVCWTGNFYADFEGLPRDDRRYETAFYELARHVDGKYRTRQPELVPLSQVE